MRGSSFLSGENFVQQSDVLAWRELLYDLDDEYVDECIAESDPEFIALCLTLNLHGTRHV